MRRRFGEDVAEHVDPAGADAGWCCSGEDARLAAVGRDDPGHGVGPVEPLVAIGFEVGPVSVDDGGGAGTGSFDRSLDPVGDGRADTVGADHDGGVDDERSAVLVTPDDATHLAVVVAADVGDGDAVAELGAGRGGGVDEDRVEHRATRRVERVHAERWPDRDHHLLAAVVEGGAPDRRSPRFDDAVDQPPAVELEDAGPHEAVGGEGVGAVAGTVHDEHALAVAGEEHGGGGAGGAGADDDRVIEGTVGMHGTALWLEWWRARLDG